MDAHSLLTLHLSRRYVARSTWLDWSIWSQPECVVL